MAGFYTVGTHFIFLKNIKNYQKYQKISTNTFSFFESFGIDIITRAHSVY